MASIERTQVVSFARLTSSSSSDTRPCNAHPFFSSRVCSTQTSRLWSQWNTNQVLADDLIRVHRLNWTSDQRLGMCCSIPDESLWALIFISTSTSSVVVRLFSLSDLSVASLNLFAFVELSIDETNEIRSISECTNTINRSSQSIHRNRKSRPLSWKDENIRSLLVTDLLDEISSWEKCQLSVESWNGYGNTSISNRKRSKRKTSSPNVCWTTLLRKRWATVNMRGLPVLSHGERVCCSLPGFSNTSILNGSIQQTLTLRIVSFPLNRRSTIVLKEIFVSLEDLQYDIQRGIQHRQPSLLNDNKMNRSRSTEKRVTNDENGLSKNMKRLDQPRIANDYHWNWTFSGRSRNCLKEKRRTQHGNPLFGLFEKSIRPFCPFVFLRGCRS